MLLPQDHTLMQTLKNTLDYLQSWSCGNCWPQYPPARVRAQDYATQANATWQQLTSHMGPSTRALSTRVALGNCI